MQAAPSGCAVCRWYDQLDNADRLSFDRWLAEGGAVKALWRACRDDPERPLNVTDRWFAMHVADHRRGGADVS